MIWLFCLFFSTAQAGYLRMVGTPHLKVQKITDRVVISGDYQILNDGDEQALQVYPEIQIDGYNWKGHPEDLQPGQGAKWELDDQLRPLCLKVSEKCPVALPDQGEFLVKVRKHYSDLNKYEFDVPDLFTVNSLEKESGLEKPLQIDLKIRPPQSGESQYRVEYVIKNRSDESVKAILNPLLPREMKLINPALPVQIPAQGQAEGSFEFENEKGTPGSNYVGFLTAEWADGDSRLSAFAFATFQIQNPRSAIPRWTGDQIFFAWFLWSLAVGLIAMWFFWVRPLQKLHH